VSSFYLERLTCLIQEYLSGFLTKLEEAGLVSVEAIHQAATEYDA
jgi:hypothetical protein